MHEALVEEFNIKQGEFGTYYFFVSSLIDLQVHTHRLRIGQELIFSLTHSSWRRREAAATALADLFGHNATREPIFDGNWIEVLAWPPLLLLTDDMKV